tara:strand:+ start:4426 stop:5181 length:756 start_codon:yes stop_codon:yes gene_type:complete
MTKQPRNKFVPKIMIGIPTYEGKNYCLSQFLDNISKFTYPRDRIELFIADNSKDNTNALMINKKYGIKTFWKDYRDLSVWEKLADTHNQIRRHFLESDCNYLFHLESDIFPPKNIIETLLWARKPIVNGLYQIGDASNRNLCIQLDDKFLQSSRISESFYKINGFHHFWVEGKVQPTYIAGIGCCLMKRKVMKNFEFRSEGQYGYPPDTYFALDLRVKGIQNYVDTSALCFHWNKEDWGRHFEYIKYLKTE